MKARGTKLAVPEAAALLVYLSGDKPDAAHAGMARRLTARVLPEGRMEARTKMEAANAKRALRANAKALFFQEILPEICAKAYADAGRHVSLHARQEGVMGPPVYSEHLDPWRTDGKAYSVMSDGLRASFAPALAEWAYIEGVKAEYSHCTDIYETRAYLKKFTALPDFYRVEREGAAVLCAMREGFARDLVRCWAMSLRMADYREGEAGNAERFYRLVSVDSLRKGNGFAPAGLNETLARSIVFSFGEAAMGTIAPAMKKLKGLMLRATALGGLWEPSK